MEKLIADFVQFSRVRAKSFLNLPHFLRSLKSFGILFGNSYIHFVVIRQLFNRAACIFLTQLPIFNITKIKSCYNVNFSVYFPICRQIDRQISKSALTHFSPMSHIYTPWKRQKTYGFLTFSEGIEMWHWTKMG